MKNFTIFEKGYLFLNGKKKQISSHLIKKTKKIQISQLLIGQQSGIPLKYWVKLSGEEDRISVPLVSSPYVSFLMEVQKNKKLIYNNSFLENSPYFKLGLICINTIGHFMGAKNKEELKKWMQTYFLLYQNKLKGQVADIILKIEDGHSKQGDPIKLRKIKHSNCYEIIDGHHRVAMDYLMGKKEIRAIIIDKGYSILQEKLLKINITHGRELYQPIDKLDVLSWPVIRRCDDRFEMMRSFLLSKKIKEGSVLDLACSYGFFLKKFKETGLNVFGLDRDKRAIEICKLVNHLDSKELKIDRIENFLQNSKCQWDIVLFLSILHHYIIGKEPGEFSQILKQLDKITGKILFLDMGQNHEEWFSTTLANWDEDYIIKKIKENTSFKQIIPLGKDKDNLGKYTKNYGRTLFACVR